MIIPGRRMPPWQFARKSYLSSFHPQKRGHKRFSSRHQKKLSKLDLVCYYLSVSPVVLIRIRDSSVGSQALRRWRRGRGLLSETRPGSDPREKTSGSRLSILNFTAATAPGSLALVHGRICRHKKLHEFAHVVDFSDPAQHF
jgi:hypothetical protein